MKAQKRDPNVHLVLRMPRDLHRLLTKAARNAKPKNSLNTEILVRLYRSFQREHADELLEHAVTQRKETEKLFNLVTKRFGMSSVRPRTYEELLAIPEDEK